MHNNVIIGLSVLAAFTLSIMLALYGLRMMDRDRQWRPRRYGLSAREVPCSFCGKAVRAEAVMCRHCHHRLDEVANEEVSNEQAGEEVNAASVIDRNGTLPPPDKRLVASAAVSSEAVIEDLRENQSFVWLDKAFAQLALKEAPAAWGPADQPDVAQDLRALGREPEQPELSRIEATPKKDLILSAAGPLSSGEHLAAQAPDSKNWLRGWKPKKDWAYAAGIASVALIVGGSTLLVGPLTSRVERGGDGYVTFDVSERAPLYAGSEGKMEAIASNSTATGPAKALEPSSSITAATEPTAVVSKVPVMLPRMEPTPAPPVTALPEVSPAVSPDNTAAKTPVSLAAVRPSESPAKSAPAAVTAQPREDWAASVARAIQPSQSRDLVVAVQRLIRAEGYDPGMIDGVLGPRTRSSIQAYQRNGGLRPTGEIDRDLLQKLNLADRTVRVVGPLSGGGPSRQSNKPPVEWTK